MKTVPPATIFFPLLLASLSACSPGVPRQVDDGKHGYVAPPPATDGDMSDTGAYHERNIERVPLDTVGKTGHPQHPDSTNVMPPR